MRKLAFVLALLSYALASIGAHAQPGIACDKTAVYDASTNGSTRLVVGRSTAPVYICGFNLWGAGTATVKLVTGTGTACATNEAPITPAYSLIAQSGVPDSSPYYRGLLAIAGLDVCIKTSAGVAVQAQIYYSQK